MCVLCSSKGKTVKPVESRISRQTQILICVNLIKSSLRIIVGEIDSLESLLLSDGTVKGLKIG